MAHESSSRATFLVETQVDGIFRVVKNMADSRWTFDKSRKFWATFFTFFRFLTFNHL